MQSGRSSQSAVPVRDLLLTDAALVFVNLHVVDADGNTVDLKALDAELNQLPEMAGMSTMEMVEEES
jgi:exosome complex RNA-binding protein Rrp42 (RNase PH superfamily)